MSYKNTFFKGISFSYLYISIYLITGLLTTPLLLNYFKADYFALLMLMYAIVTYLNNIRFGLPESLAALLAKSKDKNFNAFLVKKNYLILVMIVLFALVLLFIAEYFVYDWRIILGDVYKLNKDNVTYVFYLFVIFALLKIPFDISLSVFIGFHEVYLEKIYKIIIPLVNFALVCFVVYNEESIVFFAFWAGLLDLLISIISFIHAFMRYEILKLTNTRKQINSSKLLKVGMLFFQLSITQTLIWSIGIFLVSHMLSLEDVTKYSLSMKIYVYIFYSFVIVNTVIAPMYGKYFSENSWENIRKVFNSTILLLPFLGGFIWVGTLYFMPDIIAIWTGSQEFYINSFFVLFMGIFFYFTGYVNSYITLLYSIGEVKSVVYIRWKEVFVNVLVSIVATYFIGLTGIAIGMSLAIIFVSARYLPKYIEDISEDKISLDFLVHRKHFIYVLLPSVVVAFVTSNFIDVFLIKLVVFLVMSIYYVLYSWNVLSAKDKVNIMTLLNSRKKKVRVEK